MTENSFNFSNDQPITDKQHDRLNRIGFADRVVAALRELPKGTGLVVGIHGPWGEGKTTLLNLLRADLSIDEAIVVRDFNPWRLTDDEAMLRGFFSVLADAIGASLSTTFERATTGVGKWAKRVRWVTKTAGWLLKSFDKIDDLLESFSEVAQNGDSVKLEELRKRIIGHLKQSNKMIVLLIDDIDRLDKDETHKLFRLIKACADFPNVCYVLAFDEAAVAKALGERYAGGDEFSGRSFLEKIIQVPLRLPMAATEDLRALCFEQVDRALNAAGMELSKEQIGEFITSFDKVISVRLNTPRAAKRFVNGLMFALPMLKGETNPTDLLLVEALRSFFPEVYNIVRDNYSDFCGIESDLPKNRDESLRSYQLLAPLFESMPTKHADAVKELLVDLFPRLSGRYSHTNYSGDRLPRWSRERRICAPDYCLRYFTYAVQLNDVSNAEVTAILDAADQGDAKAVKFRLTRHLTNLKAKRLIEKLREVETEIKPQAAETLAIAIAELGPQIPNPRVLFYLAEPPAQAAILISHLLQRISSGTERISVGKRVIDTVVPLWFAAQCVNWLYVTDKLEKQDANTFTKEEAAEVRQVLVKRIKISAAAGQPLFDPDLRQEKDLLYQWRLSEGRDPVQAHLERVFTKDPKQVSRFLEAQAPLVWSGDDVIPHVGNLDGDQLKSIKFIIDLDILAERVRNQCPGDFNNPEWFSDNTKPLDQRLAEQFMYNYNQWKKNGEPVDEEMVKINADAPSDS